MKVSVDLLIKWVYNSVLPVEALLWKQKPVKTVRKHFLLIAFNPLERIIGNGLVVTVKNVTLYALKIRI